MSERDGHRMVSRRNFLQAGVVVAVGGGFVAAEITSSAFRKVVNDFGNGRNRFYREAERRRLEEQCK